MGLENRLQIRTVCPASDMAEVHRLYRSGLLEGEGSPGDCASDIENLVDAYLSNEGDSRFWVAELKSGQNSVHSRNRGSASIARVAAESGVGTNGARSGLTFSRPHNGRTVIGMIGARCTGEDTIEIRRLRVDPKFRQHGVGKRLIETALDFCYQKRFLKVRLDTRVERLPAIALFEQSGFQLNRTREVNGRKIHDFYLDLYRRHD